MSYLVDWQIRNLCKPTDKGGILGANDKPLIDPFSEEISGSGVISYGLSSAGYDLRLSAEGILLFKNGNDRIQVDPKQFHDEEYRRSVFTLTFPQEDGAVYIPPGGYILGRTVEYLRIPSNLSGTCVGKSTLARCGILVNTTPLEPGWEGYLTLEIGNVCSMWAVVYVNEGIAQLRLELLNAMPHRDYAAKSGKYQGQAGTTPAIVK